MSLLSDAIINLKSGKIDEAENQLHEVLSTDAENAVALNMLGIVKVKKNDIKLAEKLIRRSLDIMPERADFHHNLALIQRAWGDYANARESLNSALSLNPNYPEAYYHLAHVGVSDQADEMYKATVHQLNRDDLSSHERCFLYFALGKLNDDSGQYQQAIEFYKQGSAERQANFDPITHSTYIDKLITCFNADVIQSISLPKYTGHKPIFIVGMPRSGTSLVEQILASHPQVFGAGELSDIPQIADAISKNTESQIPFPDYASRISDEILHGFGLAYLQRVNGLAGPGYDRIVDKLPENCMMLGLISMMLPKARVIHCMRNPMDTALSCFSHKFDAGQEWSYDFQDIAHYYREYQRLMAHWSQVIVNPYHSVQYENLVAEPEKCSRQLLEFVELPWHNNCLEFNKTKRPVLTASNAQVREKIYSGSVERWRRYMPAIKDLKSAMKGL